MKAPHRLTMVATAVLVTGGLTAAAPSAQASPNSSYTCNGDLGTGTYGSVWVPEGCTIPDGAHVTVLHGISVGAGASFNASTHSTLAVHGNVSGGPGSFVALGCTEAHPCTDHVPGHIGDDVIDGNITLDHVYDAAINGVTVGRNITSVGGGAGLSEEQFIPFSIKDDTVGGNISVSDLETTWFGVIRSDIGGNVTLTDITLADPDGNEIVSNRIGRNLVCSGLSPAPQLGDAVEGAPPGYGPNVIGGKAVGQCAELNG